MMATFFSLPRNASILPTWGLPSVSAPAVYIVLICRYNFLLLVHRTFCLSLERRWYNGQPPPALDWHDWKQLLDQFHDTLISLLSYTSWLNQSNITQWKATILKLVGEIQLKY
jgi:hypothetical protein